MFKQAFIENTIIGSITIVFSKRIEEIILSSANVSSCEIAYEKYGDLCVSDHPVVVELLNYFNKDDFNFSVDDLNFSKCGDFQKSVLMEEFKTPFGEVNHYKDLAMKIDNPNSSRAVGNALRNNPFPIIIPCHRTIKVNGEIGGFNGGLNNYYKKILLEHEGHFVKNQKIIT